MTTMEERVSRLEGAYEQLDQWLGDLMGAVRGLDAKVDALRTDIDGRFDSLRADIDGRFDALRHEMNSKFNTLIIVMATVGIAMVGAMFTLALRL